MKVTELKEIYDKYIEATPKSEASDFPFNQYVNIKEYIPITIKLDVAQKAAAELFEEYDGVRTYDFNSAKIIEDLTVVSLYTDLDYDEEEIFTAYDILVQTGFFDYLFSMDYDDVMRFREMLSCTLEQIVDEYNSLPNIVNRGLLRLENRMVDAINNFADKASMDPESIKQLQDSLVSISSTMKKVEKVKAADVVEAYKE